MSSSSGSSMPRWHDVCEVHQDVSAHVLACESVLLRVAAYELPAHISDLSDPVQWMACRHDVVMLSCTNLCYCSVGISNLESWSRSLGPRRVMHV